MNKFFIVAVVFFSFFIAGCSNENESFSSKISVSKLSDVLIDLHFASTAKSLNLLNPSDKLPKNKIVKKILAQHKISESELKESIKYYSHKPDSLSAIYIIMIEKISTKQAQIR